MALIVTGEFQNKPKATSDYLDLSFSIKLFLCRALPNYFLKSQNLYSFSHSENCLLGIETITLETSQSYYLNLINSKSR